jgi:hypothetical protein
MKYLLIPLFVLGLCAPLTAVADEGNPRDEFGTGFLYEFPLTWENGRVVMADRYTITSGNASALVTGSWTLIILDGARQPIERYLFDPSAMAVDGALSLKIPKESRGATAVIVDGAGAQTAEFDLRWSRVCDDDGVCQSDAGEDRKNCPTDCGGYSGAEQSRTAGTATIASAIDTGTRFGGILLRLSLGAAGLILLIGAWHMLDSSRVKRDNLNT